MDPLTAFTVAAATIQVFDFSVKALKLFRELHETGKATRHEHIDNLITHLGDISSQNSKRHMCADQ